jgi:hypothetical protein
MNLKTKPIVEQFCEARSDDELEQLRQRLQVEGYSAFRELLDDLNNRLKRCDESDMREVREALSKARRILPQPGRLSPSWEHLWEQMERWLADKEEVLRQVPREARDGEWQIVMDNPYSHDAVVCYPGLPFIEAAFLYAYFRAGLKKNEYIRLQKVVNLIMTYGE